MDNLGPLSEKLKDVEGLEQGAGKTPTAITFHPAMIAAKKMERRYMISYKNQMPIHIYEILHLKWPCLEQVLLKAHLL